MAKFDLTSQIGQYLDRHLVFPLLEFLSAKQVRYQNPGGAAFEVLVMSHVRYLLQIYDEDELLQAKLDILSKTNMIDYTIDIRKQLYPNIEVPEVCFIAFPYVYVCTLY